MKLSEVEKDIVRLETKVESLRASMLENERETKEIKGSLYDPDRGLYRRVSSVTETLSEQEKTTTALEKRATTKFDTFDNRLRTLEEVQKNLLDIAGANLEHLRAVIASRKRLERVWYATISIVLPLVIGTVWNLVSGLITP